MPPHQPPFTITPRILSQVAECCERVGHWRGAQGFSLSPQLRRANRIRSIQASLAIENNSLSIEFILAAITESLADSTESDQVNDQVTDQVKALIKAFKDDAELTTEQLLQQLGLSHKPTFRKNYLNPALAAGFIEMTQPDSPRSPTQRYRLTTLGKRSKVQLP